MSGEKLFAAARAGDLAAVKAQLDAGTDLKATNDDGETALHLASMAGHKEVVKLLLARGVPADVQNKYGWTALHLAATTRCTVLNKTIREARCALAPCRR